MTDARSTIPALWADVVARRADHPAILTANEAVSYRELDRRSARLARALLAAGAGKGTRLALLAPDGVAWVTSYLAALRIGALLTTVSTLCAPPELAHILRNSDCQHLIAARRFMSHDYAAALESALPGLAGARAGRLQLPRAPYLRSVWLDDAAGVQWAGSMSELTALADGPDAPGPDILAAVEREVTPGEDAIVVYTSGSTAQPKAVVHRHWALARHSRVLAEQFALLPGDRVMPLLPAFWLAGMSMMLQVLSVGGTLVYPETPENDHILDLIVRLDVTRVNAWGERQIRLVEAAQARGLAIGHIPDLVAQRDAVGNVLPLVPPSYGMTETCSAHCSVPMNVAFPPDKAGAYGRAIGGYELRVVDPETGREVSCGEIGELHVRGPALTSGFYKMARETVFTPEGYYPTKDLVRIDVDGFLFPEGRISDMIKTRGANVSRLEVESALAALPEVATSVVAGLPDAELGEIVVAAVVSAAGASPTEAGLQASLRGALSSFKVPRRIVFVARDDLPLTGTGKIKLSQVAQMIAEHLGR